MYKGYTVLNCNGIVVFTKFTDFYRNTECAYANSLIVLGVFSPSPRKGLGMRLV